MHHHQLCPHCRSVRDAIWPGSSGRVQIRCRQCLCRWDLQGNLTYFGLRCPLMTGKQPRPKHVMNARGSEFSGREAALVSDPVQEPLL